VYIGFELLRSIGGFLKIPKGAPKNVAWHPAQIAKDWAPIARNVFERADVSQRNFGSQFVLVGPDPVEEVGIPGHAMPYLCKFSAPDFKPEIVRGGRSVISIGSGAQVPEYAEAIKDLFDPSSRKRQHFLQLEANMQHPRGRGIGFHMAIRELLEELPIDGISSQIHTHIASREGCVRMANKTGMPRVAQSLREILQMGNRLGIDAAAAVA
jgi:hypothetical protein